MLQASDWWRSSWNKSSIIVRKEKKGMSKWNLILDSIILPQTDLLSNTSTNKTANANENTARQKYKEGERNVEMKSYLGLSHSPPGLLSNTFCRRRWWEREMTNVKEEEGRAIDIYKYPQNFNHSLSFTTEYGWKTNKISNITIVRKRNDKSERRRRQSDILLKIV